MTSHTAGPWVAVKEWGNRSIVSGNGVEVAIVALPEDGDLIAAAPELLAALKAVLDLSVIPYDERGNTAALAAQNAITKAEGR